VWQLCYSGEVWQLRVKRLKNSDFDISNKERFAAVKEDEFRKDGKKSWKTSINLYCINFFIVIKKLRKIGRTFAST